ncbi:MAG: phosphatidate cytidylyltransferase [Deltaproteobacteria bacterium]|nr:phosphatidate cytidylyltransferase [Deltaproteobacteria bacterium]
MLVSASAPVSNLVLRIVSAAVLGPIAIVAAYFGGWPFALFWSAAAIAVLWEWTTLVAGPSHRLMFSSCASALAVSALVAWRGRPIVAILLVGLGALAALIFAPHGRRLWITAGIGYAGALLLAPMLLRDDPADGFLAIMLLFAIVWTTDILGYFAGRAFGGPKLMPAISPKKTWSGALAGTVGAMIVAVLVAKAFGTFNGTAIALVALLLSVVAQLGDLLESWVKRQFGAKDASQLIPGHGGVMDRLDGFWAAALVGCLIGLARGGFDAPARGLLVW